jgi:hypothetical protein
MQTIDFYRAQADAALRESQAADLPSIRERALRSAAAWTAMVELLEGIAEQKAVNDERRRDMI